MVWLVVLVIVTGTAGQSHAHGEHSTRAGAELRVLSGDVKKLVRLLASASELQLQRGLEDRIRGALSSLDILLRLADQEAGRQPVGYYEQIGDAIAFADAGRWDQLMSLLKTLEKEFPLSVPVYPASGALLESSRQMHRELCAACHDLPPQGVERPPYNLYQQAVSESSIVFYARMLVGVRGDRVTGIDNPLTDAEIAGLIHLYRSADTTADPDFNE